MQQKVRHGRRALYMIIARIIYLLKLCDQSSLSEGVKPNLLACSKVNKPGLVESLKVVPEVTSSQKVSTSSTLIFSLEFLQKSHRSLFLSLLVGILPVLQLALLKALTLLRALPHKPPQGWKIVRYSPVNQ